MAAYRLETLLELRTRAEEAAKQAFAEAATALAKEEAEQRRLEEELATRAKERRSKVQAYLGEVMAKGVGAGGLAAMNRFEGRLKEEEAALALDIERQKTAVARAKKTLELRRQEMAEAARDKKAIEKHREKWLKQVKAERDAREQENQEEIGSALFLARQRR